ncbi:hypothetical protein ACSBR1_009056 [Camellia fascicularis]
MAGSSSSSSSSMVPSLPPLRPKSLPEYPDLYWKQRDLANVQLLEGEITFLEPLENHPHFIGTYWGAVSTAFYAEIVESADAYLFAGPIFNDYSSVGCSLLLKREKAIIV